MSNKKIYIVIGVFFLSFAILIGILAYWKFHKRVTSKGNNRHQNIEWPSKDLMKGKKYDDAFDGIDISEHQGRIHWEIMDSKHRSPKFIYARVMGKQAKIDPEYHNIVNAAHSKNISVGS